VHSCVSRRRHCSTAKVPARILVLFSRHLLILLFVCSTGLQPRRKNNAINGFSQKNAQRIKISALLRRIELTFRKYILRAFYWIGPSGAVSC
jgi:hypothetical protein